MSETFTDAHGVPFARYRNHLPSCSHDFPPLGGEFNGRRWSELAGWYHEHFPFCFVCGLHRPSPVVIECHHIEGGSNRTHEACNVLNLCLKHHDQANTEAMPKGHLLWRKWVVDPANTDWVRLAIIRRRFLPDLVVHEEIQDGFEKRMGILLPLFALECPLKA